MNTWRKRLAYLVGVLALVMTGMGCRMNQHETVEQPPPAYAPTKEGGTLVIARMSDANNLDPHFISTINAASVVYQQVYEGLVTRSMNMEIQPQLATAWIQIDDMTWEFKLRKGVFFQDGTPFNATAVKKTLDRVLDPQVRSTRAAMFDKLKEVKIVDDHTVLVILTEPFVPLLSILASHEGSMISPKAIEEYGKDLSKHPVGTGPFTFHSWIPGQEIVMVKNRNYWGQAPKIDKLIFRIIVDDNERINLVRNNQAQVAESVPVDEIEKIQASPEMNVYRSEALGTEFVGFNVSREPFHDVRVRQAISSAIETSAIVKGVYNNVGTKANSTLSPKVFGYHSAGQTYPYDLNKARALLAEAGYTDRFETTISTFDRRDRVKVAEVIRSQLKGIGIDAKINVLGYTDFVELITKTKTHDLFISGWGNATGDADYNQYNLFHTIGGGDGNSFMYSNGELDRLIERGRVEKDPAKRRDIYARAQEWELREALFVPIRNQENLTAVNKHVQGFSISPAGYFMLRQVAIQE